MWITDAIFVNWAYSEVRTQTSHDKDRRTKIYGQLSLGLEAGCLFQSNEVFLLAPKEPRVAAIGEDSEK